MKSYAVLVAMVLLAGCGDDDGNSLSEYEGIWEVQSHTKNLMSCEPGDAVEDGPGFFVVFVQKAPLIGTLVTIEKCDSVDACKAHYQEVLDSDSDITLNFVGEYNWALPPSMTSELNYSGSGGGDQCDGTLSQTVVSLEEDQLQISRISAPSGPFERVDGFCKPEEKGISLDESKCNGNEVLKAVKVNKLEGVSAEAQVN